MCTLTVLPVTEGSIITMNRDERRDRHEPGILYRQDDCLYPLDSRSQGTWFGISRSGVVLALLNRYQKVCSDGRRSRGELIPLALSEAATGDWLAAMDPAGWNPFDLFLIEGQVVRHFQWNGDGGDYLEHAVSVGTGIMYTSSSFAPDEVLAWRQGLFDEFLSGADGLDAVQLGEGILTGFHLYSVPGRETHSVLMQRELSHTKSICQVNTAAAPCELRYMNLEKGEWLSSTL